MSSTGRGTQRHPDDFYATPGWATRAILPHLPRGGLVLDPCAGTGAILDAIRRYDAGRRLLGFELDEERAEACRSSGHRTITGDSLLRPDWFDEESDELPALVLTNPPFSLALEFVQRSLVETSGGGTTAMLLRLNWLGSERRFSFHREQPADLYVLHKRPSFGLNKDGKKGTDSIEYAWFVWGPGRGGRWWLL